MLAHARSYTSQYRDVDSTGLEGQAPVILVGHQPDLIHPGVWFKNFVLSSLAQRTAAHAVNLLIDNDAVRSTSVRVPSGSLDDPVSTFVALDDMATIVPFESAACSIGSFSDISASGPLQRCGRSSGIP